MKTKIVISIVFIFAVGVIKVFSQTYSQPNVALRSHETLEISKVEITPEKAVIFLTIENRVTGGNFCADKNIYIIDAEGVKLKLRRSAGIPVCPDAYKFKNIGEKLDFILEFPPLRPGIKWIDIVEECNENCFSFYGVTLNADLNENISKALEMAEKGETAGAIALYSQILGNLGEADNGVLAALYTDIITLSIEKGDKTGAEEWYRKMITSKAPRLDLYIRNLNSRGIKY